MPSNVDVRAESFKHSLLSVDVDVCCYVFPHCWDYLGN